MTTVRALVFDIDGTLAALGSHPTPATVAMITACRDRGVACFVDTARRPASAAVALGPLAWLADSGIFHAGALARCARTGFSASSELPASIVGGIVALVEASAPEATIGIHTADGHAAFGPIVPPDQVLRGWGCSARDLLPFAQARAEPACKLAIWNGDGSALTELAGLIGVRWPQAVHAQLLDHACFVNLVAAGSTKATLLAPLLAAHGLSLAETAAFGDDISDAPLLAGCGYGVGIAGGHPQVLELADEVAEGPEASGVARVLERMMRDGWM
ncbi:MAG: HAD family phosphatase [Planctomycetes bacterium]|nr:HAD family phosphatase [Planctomycetota bacterium]